MYGYYGLLGLLVFILDVYVIILVLNSSADPGVKALWVILVLFLPVVGPLLYFILGQRRPLV